MAYMPYYLVNELPKLVGEQEKLIILTERNLGKTVLASYALYFSAVKLFTFRYRLVFRT